MTVGPDTVRESVSIPNKLLDQLRAQLRDSDYKLIADSSISALFRFLVAKEVGIPEEKLAFYVYPKGGRKRKAKEGATN